MGTSHRTALVIAAAAVVLLSVGAMAAIGATTVDEEEGDLAINVTQDENFTVTITVTENGTAADGANVTVEPAPPGRTYNASGTYTADENGTVVLEPPEDDLLTDITATFNNSTAHERVVLKADGNETEENGNATDNFGQQVSSFIHSFEEDPPHPFGLYVSAFVLANNPGNPPAHAGPPADHPLAPERNLTFEVDQREGNATVTVTYNNSTAENATVDVSAIGNGQSFSANGTTDANGTFTFELPERPTMTVITVSFEDESVTKRVRLHGAAAGGPPGNGNGPGNGPGNGNGNGPP